MYEKNSVAPGTSSTVEINPEFLAALPPQIQEELLTQQRIEQQARAASANVTKTS
jgi:E3 ubiquitin-protein ligase HUWE1